MADPQPKVASLNGDSVRGVLIFWGIVALVRLVSSAQLGLAADEAYYWTWSQELAWGYHDHPPAIAGLIRLSTSLFGGSELGIRALGILMQSGVLALLVVTVQRKSGGDPWLLSVLMLAPLFFLGGHLVTPDVPLLLTWSLVIVLYLHKNWVGVGFFLGLAMLSKLTGLLLLLAFVIGSSIPGMKKVSAVLLSLLLVIPWVLWQVQHDWVSVMFQFEHAYAERSAEASLAEALGGQLGLVGPFFFLAGLVWLGRSWRARDFLWWSAALPFGAFWLASFRGPVEANWLAPAWIGLGCGLSVAEGRLKRLAWLGGLTGALLSLVALVHVHFPLWKLKEDPVDRLRWGKVLGEQVADWGQEPVVCERYQEAALIAYYGGLETTTLPQWGRVDQFDLWERPSLIQGLYVRRASWTDLEAEAYWPRIWDGTRLKLTHKERKIGEWQVYRVSRSGYESESWFPAH